MQTKKAFSFVEIIIVISIIALLAVVWMSYQWASNQKAKNTRAIWDLGTLNNSLLSYLEAEKTLPLPKWNINYFTKEAEYSHDEDWAFWVHWFVTQDLLANKYLNYLPLDPRTDQYYAYWKTLDNKFYEVAWVVKENWEYVSKVQWNYPANNWPYSLIREYNWSDFIYDNSKVSFPYNPAERILVAKINNYTGTVKIIWKNNSYIITDSNWLLSHTLVQWDTIETWASSKTTIFFSDWSLSVLEENSKLVLTELKFQQKDNLLTRINLFLESWTLWTKATTLNSEDWQSDFEIYTDDTTAAVRWTIFWIRKNSSNTSVTVIEWKVEIEKKSDWTKVIKTDWQSYNSTLTQPEFTVITRIPNNTRTWAVKEEKDLVAEFIEKNPEAITPKIQSPYWKLYLYDDFTENNDINYNTGFIKKLNSTPFISFFRNTTSTDEINISRTNSWFTINNWELTASWANKFLKYSWLDLEDNFTIEMSVKGKDLIRTEVHTLFQFWDIKAYIYNKPTKIVIKEKINKEKTTKQIINFINTGSIVNNNLYKLLYTQNWNNIALQIKNSNNIIQNNTWTLSSTNNLNNIIIWNNSLYNKPWGKNINYIKIYK